MLPTTAAMFLVFLVVLQLTSRLTLAADQGCLDIPTETNFKMEDVEGTWFPTDIVRHRNDIKINGVPLDSKCPVVSFWVPNRSKKVLMMVWNSTEGELEYKFTQKTNPRGQWQSAPDQQGSLAQDEEYKSFGGYIRLVKLDQDYAFFTFCSKFYRVLSTVALSRTGEMPPEVFDEALAILEARSHNRAEEIHIGPCGEDGPGSASGLATSLFLMVLPTALSWFGL